MDCMPLIFETSKLKYEERFTVYRNSILGNCRPREVKERMSQYAERFVAKKGWKAIWSCADGGLTSQDSFNVLVQVVNVCPPDLSAEVVVSKPLVIDCSLTLTDVQKKLQEYGYTVPLIELVPAHDDSGDFDETALALEHVRFFYENLWREWDDDNNGDYLYVDRNVEYRLRLYYDIAQNNLSKDFIRRYTNTSDEYKQKLGELRRLRRDMAASDSEQELETSDVINLAQKTHELENIVKLLQTMEDPQMRYLLAPANILSRPFTNADREYVVTMIVAQLLTANMTKTLPDETIIEHHTSPEEAIKKCITGDSILIYSGSYTLPGLLNFNTIATVTGVGEAIFECGECETSVIAQSSQLHVTNIKFIQTAAHSCLLVVKEGKTVIRNCEFHCKSNGIVVKRGAELVMENCKICGAQSAGLTVEPNSMVHMRQCEISNNGSRGNEGGIKIISSETEPATVVLVENMINGNFGHGINTGNGQITHNGDQTTMGVRLELHRNIINENNFKL